MTRTGFPARTADLYGPELSAGAAESDAKIVDFYLHLAAAFVVIRQLIQRARSRYRWDTRPTTKRLK